MVEEDHQRTRTVMSRRARRLANLRTTGFAVLAGVAVVVIVGCATTVPPSPPTTTAPPGPGPATVGPVALGVNVASWDPLYAGTNAAFVDALMKSAGLRQLRYPGGSFADDFDWSSTTDSASCKGAITSSCSRSDPLSFDRFAAQAHSAGASTFVTVNYGSGTPTEAAQWVAHAAGVPTSGPMLWEVGDESYSCYESNEHLAAAPTFVHGYRPGGGVCPSTKVMARSYAANARSYLVAMKHADPSAQIGVPWAFQGSVANGAGVADADSWNAEVLHALRSNVSFVDAHWYPFDTIEGVSSQQILASVRRIPFAADHIRSTLHRYAPQATFTVGETNISERPTTADFGPVSALFAAATSLEWLAAGATGVDWWDLNNFGSPTTGDFGLLSSGSPETEPADAPLPPYYGEVLASMLTSPGSRLRALAALTDSALGFESDLHGRRTVLLVNPAPNRRSLVTPGWFRPAWPTQIETYSAGTSADSEPIVGSTVSWNSRVSLPAESIVVLSGDASSS